MLVRQDQFIRRCCVFFVPVFTRRSGVKGGRSGSKMNVRVKAPTFFIWRGQYNESSPLFSYGRSNRKLIALEQTDRRIYGTTPRNRVRNTTLDGSSLS